MPEDSIPARIQALIRQVAGNSREIDFNRRLDEIFEFSKRKPPDCHEILKKLEESLKQEFGNSMSLDGAKRPACIVMYYEKYL